MYLDRTYSCETTSCAHPQAMYPLQTPRSALVCATWNHKSASTHTHLHVRNGHMRHLPHCRLDQLLEAVTAHLSVAMYENVQDVHVLCVAIITAYSTSCAAPNVMKRNLTSKSVAHGAPHLLQRMQHIALAATAVTQWLHPIVCNFKSIGCMEPQPTRASSSSNICTSIASSPATSPSESTSSSPASPSPPPPCTSTACGHGDKRKRRACKPCTV